MDDEVRRLERALVLSGRDPLEWALAIVEAHLKNGEAVVLAKHSTRCLVTLGRGFVAQRTSSDGRSYVPSSDGRPVLVQVASGRLTVRLEFDGDAVSAGDIEALFRLRRERAIRAEAARQIEEEARAKRFTEVEDWPEAGIFD